MPDEVMLHIFNFLNAAQRISARAVCKKWFHIVEVPAQWKNVSLENHNLHITPSISSQSCKEWKQRAHGYLMMVWKRRHTIERLILDDKVASSWTLIRALVRLNCFSKLAELDCSTLAQRGIPHSFLPTKLVDQFLHDLSRAGTQLKKLVTYAFMTRRFATSVMSFQLLQHLEFHGVHLCLPFPPVVHGDKCTNNKVSEIVSSLPDLKVFKIFLRTVYTGQNLCVLRIRSRSLSVLEMNRCTPFTLSLDTPNLQHISLNDMVYRCYQAERCLIDELKSLPSLLTVNGIKLCTGVVLTQDKMSWAVHAHDQPLMWNHV